MNDMDRGREGRSVADSASSPRMYQKNANHAERNSIQENSHGAHDGKNEAWACASQHSTRAAVAMAA